MKKRGLGRNLDVLLSRAPTPIHAPVKTVTKEGELRYLGIDLLQRGRYQPRRDFSSESLQELADSIRTQGIIQPLVVRTVANNRYEIVAGERRWRAAQIAGLSDVPALVKEIPDEAALEIAIIENIQRENLNPIEEAVALQRLLDEFAMTHQQVANAVGKSRTTVTNLLRLLSLQPDIKLLLEQGKIEMGHARALLSLDGLSQSEIANKIVSQGLSVRETERLVQQWQKPKMKANGAAKKIDPDIQRLQQQLSDQLGAMVVFQQGSKGKGKMVIHYNNLDELEGILTRIQ